MGSSPFALVIEDHADSVTIFAEALKQAGFETEVIRSGHTALTRLSSTTPNTVVLDLVLPDVAGLDILDHIRDDTKLANTNVIVTTAHPSMVNDLQEKADLVLIKPISFGQLRDLATRLEFPQRSLQRG